MDSTCSIAFSTQRTVITIVDKSAQGLVVQNVFNLPVGIDSIANQDSMNLWLDAVGDVVKNQASHCTSLVVACSPDTTLIQYIPSLPLGSASDVHDMLALELAQNSPEHTLSDYQCNLYQLEPKMDGTELLLATLVPLSFLQLIEQRIAASIPVIATTRQFSAHSALLYNYPETHTSTSMLIGVYESTVEISVLTNGAISYYNAIPLQSVDTLADICDAEIEKILSGYAPMIHGIYCFGPALTLDVFSSIKVRLTGLALQFERLNAFRLTKSTLTVRQREYCARLAHIFAPSIGAALPLVHNAVHTLEH